MRWKGDAYEIRESISWKCVIKTVEVLESRPKIEVEKLYGSIDKSKREQTDDVSTIIDNKPILSILSEAFDLPVRLLDSMQEEVIEDLFEEAGSTISKETKIIEFIPDQEGKMVPIERSESDYYEYVFKHIRENDEDFDLTRDSSATTSTEDCSWMRITVNLNRSGRWNYGISGTYRWLENRNPMYNDKDLLALTWENGMYISDTAYGYYYYSNASGFHTESLTGLVVPESNPKSINCLKDMTNSASKNNEQFFIHATVRKKASSGCEVANATYSRQTVNINWSTVAGMISGSTALAACIFVASSPSSTMVLGVISAVAAIFNSLGGVNNCYAEIMIDTTDYFNDPIGENLEEFVGVFYDVCLHRTPDVTGLTNWVNGLYNGQI